MLFHVSFLACDSVIVAAPAEWKIIKEGEEEDDSSSDEDW